MTIYDIKRRLGDTTYFFSRDSMKFFNQRMSDFRVRKVDGSDTIFYIYAPSYWDGKLMGTTERYYCTVTNKLYHTLQAVNEALSTPETLAAAKLVHSIEGQKQ